jgi:membrane-associated phospholipid phosphatase
MQKELLTTEEKTASERERFFRIGLLGLSIAFLVLTFFVKTTPFFAFDLVITKSLQTIHNFLFYYLMFFLSFIGFTWGEILLPTFTAIIFFWHKRKEEAFFILLSTFGVIVISESIKRIVARPRPNGDMIIQVGEYLKHDSFPSGHVLFYIGFFGYLLYLAFTRLKKGWFRNLSIGFFASLIILIGISRIYLGAHWFSDVLGSYLVGTIWLLLIVHFQQSPPKWLGWYFK